MPDAPRAHLVYDGDCPLCSAFVKRLRIASAVGELELVNAREGGPVVEAVRRRGLDLDEGMVLVLGEDAWHGEEALHRIALMSTRYGWLNRLNASLFSHRTLSRLAYPALRAGRT